MDQAGQKALTVALLLSLAAPARAETVEALLQRCEAGAEPVSAGYCLGYVSGALDRAFTEAAAAAFKSGSEIRHPYCAPPQTTNRQIVAIFVKYAKDQPEIWSYPADANLLNALWKAFPCR